MEVLFNSTKVYNKMCLLGEGGVVLECICVSDRDSKGVNESVRTILTSGSFSINFGYIQ